MLGKTEWAIGDGFMSASSNGGYDSHEAVCVLNLTDKPAQIEITVYFEDAPPLKGFTAQCGAQRTHHIRLDKIKNTEGKEIPKENRTHYSYKAMFLWWFSTAEWTSHRQK